VTGALPWKTAWVTGASTGIGRDIVLQLRPARRVLIKGDKVGFRRVGLGSDSGIPQVEGVVPPRAVALHQVHGDGLIIVGHGGWGRQIEALSRTDVNALVAAIGRLQMQT
jgi:NAD(P)-dependent dehydrogenase (short-subunit alcohol dehydrogenase family)